MLEAFLIGVAIWAFVFCVWRICDAGAGGWGGYRDPNKWAVNPRVMRWLIPIIVVAVCAYLFWLKHLGLI